MIVLVTIKKKGISDLKTAVNSFLASIKRQLLLSADNFCKQFGPR